MLFHHHEHHRDNFQMRLFLIRHGETEHNVAGLLAGITDSRLTNHGVLQARKLGEYITKTRQFEWTVVYCSDLQRAFRTAKELCNAQNDGRKDSLITPIPLAILREQDFGSFELLPWNRTQESRSNDPDPSDPAFKPKETRTAMTNRADTFLDDSLFPLLALDEESEQTIAVVSHGLFLGALWRALLLRFKPATVSAKQDVLNEGSGRPLEHLPSWTNTGFLELLIQQQVEPLQNVTKFKDTPSDESVTSPKLNATLQICAINSKEHLLNLKRARGGIGSSASDDSQKNLHQFFKKPKTGDT